MSCLQRRSTFSLHVVNECSSAEWVGIILYWCISQVCMGVGGGGRGRGGSENCILYPCTLSCVVQLLL